MASQLDQLIDEIAAILELSADEVKIKFTKDQLDDLLSRSRCDNIDQVSNLIDTLDIPCEDFLQDPGTPLDLSKEADEDELNKILKEQEPEPPFDTSDCIDTVDEVNEIIEKQIINYNNHLVVLGKLYEFQDNIKPLGEYYKQRIIRAAEIINDFRPILLEIKRIKAEISKEKRAITRFKGIIANLYDLILTSDSWRALYDRIKALRNEIKATKEIIDLLKDDLDKQKDILGDKSKEYPALDDGYITGLNSNSGIGGRARYITSIRFNLGIGEISDIKRGLSNYSEYIHTSVINGASSYSEIISNPLIRFELKFQNLNQMLIEREKFDKKTGAKHTYNDVIKIKNSPLLRGKAIEQTKESIDLAKRKAFFAAIYKNPTSPPKQLYSSPTYFDGVPGFSITNTSPKELSQGTLYTDYYNKFNDPVNKFFTPSERGLTNSLSLVEPNLKGTDGMVKKENQTNYYIRDQKVMETFYQEFEVRLDKRKREIRQKVTTESISSLNTALRRLANKDVEALVATGRVNLNLVEDNTKLRTITNKISEADQKFSEKTIDLEAEIERMELKLIELKPDPSKIKFKLKEMNEECFGDIKDDVDDDGCPDVKEKLGKDPFFETITEADGSLPNFTQMCYWVEFAKLATKFGMVPLPNNPSTLRYWPVGFIIPTPVNIIKIPLPIIWIPLVVITTPLGVMVLFLTINGIFISPILFILSSTGHKQHLMTVRGSSKKFGYDQFEDSIKRTINVPIGITAAADKIKRLSLPNPLTSKEKEQIKQFKEKLKIAKKENNLIKARNINKEINETKEAADNRIKKDSEKAKDILDKKETLVDALQDAKKSIMKRIDDLGNPSTSKIDKLKEKAQKRKDRLEKRKYKALEKGDMDKFNKLNEELRSDGIDLKEKLDAFSKDLSDYFKKIKLPKITIPKDRGKIDPKLVGPKTAINQVTELISNLQTQFISVQRVNVASILSLGLAKHKKLIEDVDIPDTLSVKDDEHKIKKAIDDMLNNLVNLSVGKSKKAKKTDEEIGKSQKSQAEDIEKEKNSKKKKELKEKLKKSEEDASTDFDLNLTAQTIAMNVSIISKLGAIKVDLNPFDPCCKKEEFSLDIGSIGPALAILMLARNIIKNKIDSMNINELSSLFGGKPNISVRDLRLGILSMVRSIIPTSLEIPMPSIDLSSSIKAVGGLIGSLSLPQASFPAPMKALSVPGQITLDLNILKSPLTNLLPSFLEKNAASLPQEFTQNLMTINSKDIKLMLKSFVEDNIDNLSDKLKTIYKIVEISKSAKGINLNTLESSVFKITPYGKAIEAIFIVKGLIKMNIPNSLGVIVTDLVALKPAIALIKPLINPIVSSPVAYILVAAAGVTNTLDLIRELHPILNEDDIPPWERLTLKNILFLVFLDEFVSTGADQIGFFRSYL